ncbi:MAG: hypothetical protein ACK52I_33790 [Pseudomonadota bacterium]
MCPRRTEGANPDGDAREYVERGRRRAPETTSAGGRSVGLMTNCQWLETRIEVRPG